MRSKGCCTVAWLTVRLAASLPVSHDSHTYVQQWQAIAPPVVEVLVPPSFPPDTSKLTYENVALQYAERRGGWVY